MKYELFVENNCVILHVFRRLYVSYYIIMRKNSLLYTNKQYDWSE